MKNKIFLFPLALAVIFFASFTIIFSPVGKKNIIKVTQAPVERKTYTNDQYGFEFQYPKNWTTTETDSGTFYIGEAGEKYSIEASEMYAIAIFYYKNPHKRSLNELYNSFKDKPSSEWITHETLNKIKLAGIDAYINKNNLQDEAFTVRGDYEVSIVSTHFGSEILDPRIDKVYNQILSTFKFLPDTTDWQTYTNDQHGFEFQYPSNWIKEDESTNNVCFNSPETHFQPAETGYNTDLCVSVSQNINGVINPYTTPSVTYEDLNDYYNKTSTNPAIEYQWSGLITVNNNNGYKYVSCGHGCYFGIIIENNKGIYDIEFITAFNESKLTDIQKQILSTFKFTDNNISTKCTTDKDCSSTSFCDYNSPGGMGPNGFVAGEPYGSQKCILKCQSDDQCPSGQCQNFEIVMGDILDHVKGCKP